MLFNSYVFMLAFLPITLIGYYVFNRFGKYFWAKCYLLIASLFYYAYFYVPYLPIILGSIAINYGVYLCYRKYFKNAEDKKTLTYKKALLVLALACNIGLLCYFKYFDFFITNINAAFGATFDLAHLILPLGISFFTFQQIAFLVDSYRGEVPHYSLMDYSLYVTFFPRLVAGPIVLHQDLIPQFADDSNKRFNSENFAKGLKMLGIGLAKKVLIADAFARLVNWGYSSDISTLGTINAALIVLGYTMQIYFDFSGYSDMAIGIAKMMNIDLPINFNSPYKSLDIMEFWKRWHITLTRFLTKYLYFPLGGNRKGTTRTYINIMIVFLISGLWHGSAWTFILWGALHGVASVITRLFKKRIDKWHPAFSWLATFAFVNVAWVYFRADTIGQGTALLKQVASMNFTPISPNAISSFFSVEINTLLSLFHIGQFGDIVTVGLFALAILVVLNMRNSNDRMREMKPTVGSALATAVLIVWSILSFSGVTAFVYWNF